MAGGKATDRFACTVGGCAWRPRLFSNLTARRNSPQQPEDRNMKVLTYSPRKGHRSRNVTRDRDSNADRSPNPRAWGPVIRGDNLRVQISGSAYRGKFTGCSVGLIIPLCR